MEQNFGITKVINRSINVLISAYACGPNYGSEIGMGWNWVKNLSIHCNIWVITESGFKKDIEEFMEKNPNAFLNKPEFYYLDIGDKGRELFWKQGSILFYKYYKNWQKEVYNLSCQLIIKNKIDIIHQLNMLGYREPGFLWRIKTCPYVWGPIGGFGQIPWSFIFSFSLKNIPFWTAKRILNTYQMYFLKRVKNAIFSTDLLIAANNQNQAAIKKLFNKYSFIINDAGSNISKNHKTINKIVNSKLRILYVGLLNERKALPLALRTLSKVKHSVNFEFHICGNGPDLLNFKQLAQTLDVEKFCIWHGQINHSEVERIMMDSNFLFFPSLMEGTPHVVLEAISVGLPVLCHNHSGHGEAIDESCGWKIPLISPNQSIKQFSLIISNIYNNPIQLEKKTEGALLRVKVLTWEEKANEMYKLYKKLLE